MSHYCHRSNKNKNHYYYLSDSSSSSCFGTTLNNMHPAFLSPPISSSTPNATHFSTPRNKRFGIHNNCFSDIDEWLEHANKFCKSFNHHHHHLTELERRVNGRAEEEQDLRISAVCLTAPEHPSLYNIILPSVREQSPLQSNSQEEQLLMRSLKPYDDDFLNEVRRKKVEADEARNKAKHLQLMHTLRRKEDAINAWEFKQTTKAMDHMDKIQNELERKQIIASAKTHKKICSVREKAEKQKLNLRRSTMNKFQNLRRISDTHTTTYHVDTSWTIV